MNFGNILHNYFSGIQIVYHFRFKNCQTQINMVAAFPLQIIAVKLWVTTFITSKFVYCDAFLFVLVIAKSR